MNKELDLWQFIAERLGRGEDLFLLVVAKSSGSSPGRVGYKMAVAANGELCGSIGGGVMEVNLVEQSRALLSKPSPAEQRTSLLKTQVHRKDSPDASGMICSGKQTVVFKLLTPNEKDKVEAIVYFLRTGSRPSMFLTPDNFAAGIPDCPGEKDPYFERRSDTNFYYSQYLGPESDLFIIGGGHCALALSEVMSKLDFRVSIFDDRPDLNTIDKNKFADQISIIDTYEKIAEHIPDYGEDSYVVVMTLGYASDKVVIRQLCEREFKYFGVLGSKAKMATMMKELKNEGFPADKLARIRTPIGIPINSRTPEEIAVSIAAEIIAIKNAAA